MGDSKTATNILIIAMVLNITLDITFVVVVRGLFKARKNYCPLSPSFLTNRINYMLEKSETELVLVSRDYWQEFEHILNEGEFTKKPAVYVIEDLLETEGLKKEVLLLSDYNDTPYTNFFNTCR